MTAQTCAACGHTGFDVSTRIVRNEDPTETMPVKARRGEYLVPALFKAQSRCIDADACDERAAVKS